MFSLVSRRARGKEQGKRGSRATKSCKDKSRKERLVPSTVPIAQLLKKNGQRRGSDGASELNLVNAAIVLGTGRDSLFLPVNKHTATEQ